MQREIKKLGDIAVRTLINVKDNGCEQKAFWKQQKMSVRAQEYIYNVKPNHLKNNIVPASVIYNINKLLPVL